MKIIKGSGEMAQRGKEPAARWSSIPGIHTVGENWLLKGVLMHMHKLNQIRIFLKKIKETYYRKNLLWHPPQGIMTTYLEFIKPMGKYTDLTSWGNGRLWLHPYGYQNSSLLTLSSTVGVSSPQAGWKPRFPRQRWGQETFPAGESQEPTAWNPEYLLTFNCCEAEWSIFHTTWPTIPSTWPRGLM